MDLDRSRRQLGDTRMRSSISTVLAPLLLILSSGESLGADFTVQVSASDGREHRIEYRDTTSHFHVVLTNTSALPLKIFADSNSWGYDALSFRIKDGARTIEAKKPPAIFTRNIPQTITIGAGQAHVVDVYFGDPKKWLGFELPANGEKQMELCADFSVKASEEAVAQNVWIGRVSSECPVFTFVRWGQE